MGEKIPTYIKSLLRPSVAKPQGRKSWGIDLETVWIPFFTATNCQGETTIPHEALGAPIRLQYHDDGTVKFNDKTGKPVQRIAQDLSEAIKLVRENFTATLIQHSGRVANGMKDEYNAQVRMNREAGEPIINRDRSALDTALDERLTAFLESQLPETEPEREPVGASS